MIRPSLAGELRTDVSSWTVLLCYLDAAAWLDVPPAWPPNKGPRPPGRDFGRVAATAVDASRSGLPGRRNVRAAVVLNEAKRWLTDSGQAIHLQDAGIQLLDTAAVYARALSGPIIEPTVLDLLAPEPLLVARDRWCRRHPIRARRKHHLLRVLDPCAWQESLWWQRVNSTDERPDVPPPAAAPWTHAASAIAAAVWTWPSAVRDPIGIRHELRNRIVRGRAWAASGDLGT